MREHVRRPLRRGQSGRARTAADSTIRTRDAAGANTFMH